VTISFSRKSLLYGVVVVVVVFAAAAAAAATADVVVVVVIFVVLVLVFGLVWTVQSTQSLSNYTTVNEKMINHFRHIRVFSDSIITTDHHLWSIQL
jgi:amino acid transporter